MRLLKIVILSGIIMWGHPAFAQVDTVKGSVHPDFHSQYRETALKVLVGGHLQQAINYPGKEYSRKYLEVGLHKTITATFGPHPHTAISHGLSVEIAPESNVVYGFKYGAWGVFSLFVIGLNGIYYTDFDKGNFKIRPEMGIGAHPFKLTLGYNIPTISNADFKALQRSDLQMTLNILLKVKTMEMKEW